VGDVDTSAEAVRDAMLYLQRWEESLRLQAATRLTGTPLPKDFVCASRHEIEAVARLIREQATLLVTRNRQNAAAFTASDAYQKRCEQADALLREARDVISDGLESDGDYEPAWSRMDRELVARIDAHLAGEDMGRKL
jgi:hypothetical protein